MPQSFVHQTGTRFLGHFIDQVSITTLCVFYLSFAFLVDTFLGSCSLFSDPLLLFQTHSFDEFLKTLKNKTAGVFLFTRSLAGTGNGLSYSDTLLQVSSSCHTETQHH